MSEFDQQLSRELGSSVSSPQHSRYPSQQYPNSSSPSNHYPQQQQIASPSGSWNGADAGLNPSLPAYQQQQLHHLPSAQPLAGDPAYPPQQQQQQPYPSMGAATHPYYPSSAPAAAAAPQPLPSSPYPPATSYPPSYHVAAGCRQSCTSHLSASVTSSHVGLSACQHSALACTAGSSSHQRCTRCTAVSTTARRLLVPTPGFPSLTTAQPATLRAALAVSGQLCRLSSSSAVVRSFRLPATAVRRLYGSVVHFRLLLVSCDGSVATAAAVVVLGQQSGAAVHSRRW